MNKSLFVSRTVTEVHTTDLDGTGALWWVGNNCYRYVKFAVTMTQGNPAAHGISTAATVTGVVTQPATANLMMMAGVVLTNVSTATYSYGWIQVYGHCATVLVTGTVAAGSYVKGVNAATYVTVDAATQPAYKRNAQLLEAATTATGTGFACFVNCLD